MQVVPVNKSQVFLSSEIKDKKGLMKKILIKKKKQKREKKNKNEKRKKERKVYMNDCTPRKIKRKKEKGTKS